MKIESYDFSGEGMKRVYENTKWTVGIKNWKPTNDISQIDSLERHHLTDELFVLLEGSCTLIYAIETEQGLTFYGVKMEKEKVYNIPQLLWHNTITDPETKLILIEDSNTSSENSSVITLSKNQIECVQALAR